jgi:hypothetical protein
MKECVDGLCKCTGEPCAQNDTACQGPSSVATCVKKDECWTWGTPTSCAWDQVCDSGTCINKCDTVVCDDGNDCTDDSCSNGQCSYLPANGSSCSDGNGCTVNDKCSAGTCVGGGAKVCSDGKECTSDACTGGSCKYTNLPNGSACSAGKCSNGACVCTPKYTFSTSKKCGTAYCIALKTVTESNTTVTFSKVDGTKFGTWNFLHSVIKSPGSVPVTWFFNDTSCGAHSTVTSVDVTFATSKLGLTAGSSVSMMGSLNLGPDATCSSLYDTTGVAQVSMSCQ